MLKDTIPLHSFDYGIVSGIRTDWDVQDGMLTCKRPGFSPQSGDITLYPLQSGSEDQSFVVTDNVTELWKIFKKYGIKFHELKKSNYPKKNISLNHILVSVYLFILSYVLQFNQTVIDECPPFLEIRPHRSFLELGVTVICNSTR